MLSTLVSRDPDLAAIVQRLVDCYGPERIYLFGSRATENAGPDSDYDLFVLVSDHADAEHRDCALFYRNQLGLRRGADVIVSTRSSFEHRAARVASSLPATVLREGELLFAA